MWTEAESTAQRRAMRCSLPGFDERHWGDGGESPRYYLGRLPIVGPQPAGEEHDDPRRPTDDHTDGCPGAWYRSGFVASLAKYERILTDGGFSANLLADRCDDRLVLEALQYIEHERVRARSHWAETRHAKET